MFAITRNQLKMIAALAMMVPVFAEVFDTLDFSENIYGKWFPLLGFAVGLLLLSVRLGGIQYFAMLTLPLLAVTDERREKKHLKYFFYVFYPAHLMLIGGVSTILAYI